jgi:hypothetical protein
MMMILFNGFIVINSSVITSQQISDESSRSSSSKNSPSESTVLEDVLAVQADAKEDAALSVSAVLTR